MAFHTTLAELVRNFQGAPLALASERDATKAITRISAVEEAQPGDLVFVDKAEYIPHVVSGRPTAVVTSAKLKDEIAATGTAVLVTSNVGLAHALLKTKYADRDYSRSGWSGVHPSAIVHPSAEVDPSVLIEPGVVIGAGVKIARNCRLMANTVIESGVTIDHDTIVHPGVVIGYDCRIGAEVIIGAGTVIGSEGYGFAQDEKRKSHRIPQTGIVVIEDRVRVGANCCIDRAAYKETRIGAGTKLDNLCHIAHNVTVGEDCLLTAMLVVAGSSKIGNRVITSGNTGVLDHVEVCDDVVLLHRAGVTKNVEKPGAYAGLPLQPLQDYMKNAAAQRSLADLRKRLAALEKHLGGTGEDRLA